MRYINQQGNYLPMHKGRYKVSDVCQLLDKSKYPATQTRSGVTVTKNYDGTLTVSGTSTATDYIHLGPAYPRENNGHILLLRGADSFASIDTYSLELLNQYNAADYGNGVIVKSNSALWRYWGIYFQNGITFNDVILKPQLFDLTEMYGAGNEPKTVAQFKQDFPDELYPYSPYCWAKIKGLRYLTTTKNLFDNIPVKTNYIINAQGEEVATPGYNIYGKIYGKNFTFSIHTPVVAGEDNWLRICYYGSDGTFVSRDNYDFGKRTVVSVQNNNASYIQLTFSKNSFPNYKLQVELGDTATNYVPYGYLPLK